MPNNSLPCCAPGLRKPLNSLAADADGPRFYAIRRVNPFLGVLQVIETGEGRATSTNGVVWLLEIRVEVTGGWGSLNRNNRVAGYYRYGRWSAADGLSRWPLAPNLDAVHCKAVAAALIGHVRAGLSRLPFRLEDDCELWLFDKDAGKPLALLATRKHAATRPVPEPGHWCASASGAGVPGQNRFPAAAELESLVRQRAGFDNSRVWIQRHADGSGSIETSGIRMNAGMFPLFLLTEEWPDAEQARLVCSYLEWTAPALLTLQQLDRDARRRGESWLQRQAMALEHHWRLYPEIIDAGMVSAARVQCRLQE